MKHSEILKQIAWYLFVAVFVIYSVVVGWWLIYPYNPITIKSIEIVNTGKTVKAGEYLTYKISYYKNMDIPGTLTRKLVNNYKIDMAESIVTAPIGRDCDKVTIRIPHYADVGTYYLWWSVTYQVNPIRKVTVTFASERFEVVK